MALLLLAAGLAGSALGASAWGSVVRTDEQELFERQANEIAQASAATLQRDVDFHDLARSLIAVTPTLTDAGINDWFASATVDARYPGVNGFGFVQRIAADQLPAFEAAVETEGGPADLLVVPPGARSEYCLLRYTVGGTAEQVAALRSVDWCIALSGHVHTVTRSGRASVLPSREFAEGLASVLEGVPADLGDPSGPLEDITLILSPVYAGNDAPLTRRGRDAAVIGWMLAVLELDDVAADALHRHPGWSLSISTKWDGEEMVVGQSGDADDTAFVASERVVADVPWTISVSGPIASSGVSGRGQVLGVFAGGAAISVCVSILVLVLAHSRRRALTLVDIRTEELRHQALHDSLTGLPNRALVLDRAEQMLAHARREHTGVALLFVDLDNFKHINDTLGHAAGDRLLVSVAERLSSAIRQEDTVGRLGGDEFVVLSPAAGPDAARLVAQRVLDAMRPPFALEATGSHDVTASIGVAVGLTADAGELLRDADIALYEAKDAGRNCFVLFEQHMQDALQSRHEPSSSSSYETKGAT